MFGIVAQFIEINSHSNNFIEFRLFSSIKLKSIELNEKRKVNSQLDYFWELLGNSPVFNEELQISSVDSTSRADQMIPRN